MGSNPNEIDDPGRSVLVGQHRFDFTAKTTLVELERRLTWTFLLKSGRSVFPG